MWSTTFRKRLWEQARTRGAFLAVICHSKCSKLRIPKQLHRGKKEEGTPDLFSLRNLKIYIQVTCYRLLIHKTFREKKKSRREEEGGGYSQFNHPRWMKTYPLAPAAPHHRPQRHRSSPRRAEPVFAITEPPKTRAAHKCKHRHINR